MTGFDDLLANNARYGASHDHAGFDGIAHAGVLIVTCMDSRIMPLDMVGLGFGDAKIIRTPGGYVDDVAVRGCILGVHLLNVQRILVVQHTKCALARGYDGDIAEAVKDSTGADVSQLGFHATPDQMGRLRHDVALLRQNPLLEGRCEVGGFVLDVDTGLLEQIF